MKRRNYMMISMFISGLFFASGFALSSEGIQDQPKDLLMAKLSMDEAIATAKTKAPGQVLEAELEVNEGMLVYEIEIASMTGVVTEIKIDAQSGKFLSSEIEDHDDTEHEQSEVKAED